MHACELVELAALVCANGPVLIRGEGQVSKAGVEQYWTASKCRLDRWGRSLRKLTDEVSHARPQWRHSRWPHARSVLEEVLISEVLTRLFTAVMSAYDRRRGTDLVEPVARSVLIGHLEARNRVLTLLVRGPGIDAEQALKLNQLRRRVERWTDLLIGYLAGLDDVEEFAFEPDRAKDFAEDLDQQHGEPGGRHAWPLVLGSLRAAFREGICPLSPNADLNTRIAQGVLSCFRPEVFDSVGLFRSLWLMRLSNTTSDAEGMLEALLETSSSNEQTVGALPARWSGRPDRFGKS